MDIKIYSFDEIIEIGKKVKDEVELYFFKFEDLVCIMYIFGFIGILKGVVLIYYNIVVGIGGVGYNVIGWIGLIDCIIVFLLLVYIFELVFEFEVFYWNGIFGYGSVKILINILICNCKGDLVEFKFIIMIGVVVVWEIVRKVILEKISDLIFVF